ncbi:MAG: DUF411 domain-containing protein [Reyranella sp.]
MGAPDHERTRLGDWGCGMRNGLCVIVVLAGVAAIACAGDTPPEVPRAHDTPPATVSDGSASTRSSMRPRGMLIVHRSPSCGCCTAWIRHMSRAGFDVQVRNADDLTPIKARVGVPAELGACHTAEVAGYFIEGHVPAEDVARLLAERPMARGLSVPGMPRGSPGMPAGPGDAIEYDVLLVGLAGSTRVYAHHTR